MTAVPKLRICDECAGQFFPVRLDQRFCCGAHRRDFHNREAARGGQAYATLMAWRSSRGKVAFSQVSRQVDEWRREDAARAEKVKAARAALRAPAPRPPQATASEIAATTRAA